MRNFEFIGVNFLKITVKRDTGVMGGLAKVSLFIDDEEKLKLKNNEEQLFVTDKDSVFIQAKQLFFSSKPMKLNNDEYIFIKLNQKYLSLFYIAIFCSLLSYFTYDIFLKVIFASGGFIFLIIAIISGSKRYFILEKVNEQNRK